MKRNIRVGEGYALTKRKPKYIKLRYLSLLAVLTIMCLYAVKQVSAQQAEPAATAVADIKPLQIGDTIPEWLWNLPLQVVNHPERKDTITLNEYRGKLIILDFWATWCGSCIAAMPGLHNLQRQFGDDMVIVPVTTEAQETVAEFLQSNKTVKELSLFSVIDDGALKSAFPHTGVPNYVWIDAKSKVTAITATHQLTQENISKTIAGQHPVLMQKLEIDLRNPAPLFLKDDLYDTELEQYTIFLKGMHYGLPTLNIKRRNGEVVYGRMITNFPLLSIFQTLAPRLFKSVGERYSPKRFVIESDKREGLSYHLRTSGRNRENWVKSNVYSFDIIVPLHKSSQLDSLILHTLNDFTAYNGNIINRDTHCYVLRKLGDIGPIKNMREKGGAEQHISKLIVALDDADVTALPVVDESGFQDLDAEYEELKGMSIKEINHWLGGHGLELIEAKRRIAMFVIRDDPTPADSEY